MTVSPLECQGEKLSESICNQFTHFFLKPFQIQDLDPTSHLFYKFKYKREREVNFEQAIRIVHFHARVVQFHRSVVKDKYLFPSNRFFYHCNHLNH